MENNQIFFDIIDDYIKRNDINMNTFSRIVNICQSSISDWMHYHYFPSINSALKIADFFNCSLDYLFGLSENQEYTPGASREDFIIRFDRLVKSHKLTFYRVAKECGFGQSAISKWHRGKRPKIETLIVLANYLGCSMDYLVGRTDW